MGFVAPTFLIRRATSSSSAATAVARAERLVAVFRRFLRLTDEPGRALLVTHASRRSLTSSFALNRFRTQQLTRHSRQTPCLGQVRPRRGIPKQGGPTSHFDRGRRRGPLTKACATALSSRPCPAATRAPAADSQAPQLSRASDSQVPQCSHDRSQARTFCTVRRTRRAARIGSARETSRRPERYQICLPSSIASIFTPEDQWYR
jgi:hypothetical protein